MPRWDEPITIKCPNCGHDVPLASKKADEEQLTMLRELAPEVEGCENLAPLDKEC